MTKQTIMAREAGLQEHIVFSRALEAFAELVRKDEREACAKVCDDMSNSDWSTKQCAEFIRARGQA
jgi:hypothetical protein